MFDVTKLEWWYWWTNSDGVFSCLFTVLNLCDWQTDCQITSAYTALAYCRNQPIKNSVSIFLYERSFWGTSLNLVLKLSGGWCACAEYYDRVQGDIGMGFGGLHGRGAKKQDPAIERELVLSLEEVFHGCTKKMQISRRVGNFTVEWKSLCFDLQCYDAVGMVTWMASSLPLYVSCMQSESCCRLKSYLVKKDILNLLLFKGIDIFKTLEELMLFLMQCQDPVFLPHFNQK